MLALVAIILIIIALFLRNKTMQQNEFIIFANNKNATYDVRDFFGGSTFVFCNHGELFESVNRGTHPIIWFSRYNHTKSGTWNQKINGGNILPRIREEEISLHVCSNYRRYLPDEKQSDLTMLQESQTAIEKQLKHKCQLVDERELWSLFSDSDIPHGKHLSTGSIAALYIRKNNPNASIRLVGFTKGNEKILLDEPHSYTHEKQILTNLRCIFT